MADLSAPPLEATTAPAETSNTSPLNINCEVAISHVAHFIQSDECPSGIELPDLSHLSNSEFLQKVSELLLLPSLTECICIAFFPVLTDLVGRWASLGDESIERVAGALGRLIHIEPKLKRYTQELLLGRPSFLRCIASLTPETSAEVLQQQFSTININDLREALLAAWRLVIFSQSIFIPLLPHLPLLSLLQHPDLSIRYLAIELLYFRIGLADAARAKWMERYIGAPEKEFMAPYEGMTIDYGVMPLFESDRIYYALEAIKEREYYSEGHGRKLMPTNIGRNTGDICGVLIPRFDNSTGIMRSGLVMTENTIVNLPAIARVIVDEKPLLLQSVPGAGKSFLIDEVAKLFGRYDDLVRITLTDQTDAKLLLGTYVTTTPGSFTWRAGILTTAVKEGKWIVIEDIERAGNDVLSVLLPLLEGRPLSLSGRGQVEMAKGGQLIATTSLLSGSKSAQIENMLGINRWSRVTVIPPTDADLLEIVTVLIPQRGFIAPVLLQVYTSLRDLYNTPALRLSRKLSPRDLLKWTKRTFSLCSNITGESIPREIWDDIFLEAVDCFAAMIPSLPSRSLVIEKIGIQMGFPSERIKLYLESHAPTLTQESSSVRIGRVTIPRKPGSSSRNARPFAYTNHAKRLVEQLAVGVLHREPLLLVGETGTGKTTIVQHLADLLHHRLVVVNVSQQTESSDLLGGYKPIDPRTAAVQIKEAFEGLFERTFSMRRNEAFLARISKCYRSQKWPEYVKLLKEAISKAELRFQVPTVEDGGAKKKRRVEGDLKEQWAKFSDQLQSFEMQLSSGKGKSHAFSFVEGSLVKALKRGDWLLLDEINLAAADTLESIAGLIREGGSITLPEKGDLDAIKPHPDFRIFACMNPATDVGKRDLPPALRGQLTEIYVGSPDESMADLLLIIKQYIGHLCVGDERAASDVARLYLKIKAAAEQHDIVDGVGQKPHFSIRTLTRTLTYVVDTSGMYGLRRALYEGFCMSFNTMLERESREKVVQTITDGIYGGSRNLQSALRSLPKRPEGNLIQLGHYWIEKGVEPLQENPHYIVKPGTSVERNLLDLVRASLTRRYPILLQGPTSSGKTSMIEHLAKLTGHKFLRINNHEHTSLDEYLGNYVSTPTGEFFFQEGILVEALRKGYWIVLDELNLAPSDVLEALNRLLDDNRELLIPETQEVITPHSHFTLFATQNPAGLYGGRKVLSRAFRNRFLELEFDDIPEDELEEILCLRCQIPPSYGAKIVEVYKQLSMQRQSTRLFEQRNSFATLRDLFRWAQREAVGYQQLAENGYMLLAERVRRDQERLVVKQVIEKVMKVKIDENVLYGLAKLDINWTAKSNLIWTKAMRRLFILVNQALVNNEPVLLVGETGCGKTTVCQVLAEKMGKPLHIINAHQNTETGDIIGGQRPYRDRQLYQSRLVEELRAFFSNNPESTDMGLDDLAEEFSKMDVERLLASSNYPENVSADIERIRDTFSRQKTLFEWVDGALVQAMKQGEPFLLDEISLADDSVLERLNSVLESSRSIVLAEKGGDEVFITATEGFQFFATMNPGGDYGKKELSPALRNRFTEIWVPAVEDREDLIQIVQGGLASDVQASEFIVDFAEWFTKSRGNTGAATISIRDILAWVGFVNATYKSIGEKLSLFHGAMMVYVDGIGTTAGTEFLDVQKEKAACVAFLSDLLQEDISVEFSSPVNIESTAHFFSLGHFQVPRGVHSEEAAPFSFRAPTTASNGMKVLRAMQLPKSILLEGAPGIGKTSLITAIATAAAHPLTRINLSDQTDLMDLFGSDAPVEGGRGGEFAWRDAPFLRAMQNGGWVLLDELNLASQSVLEGLNACLDHRGTAYIPELNRSFTRHPDFRIFAAQNPHSQGGGRKGLPKSFVNRFSVVYVESLSVEDMCIIGNHLFPTVDAGVIQQLISFIMKAQTEANSQHAFGSLGRPWEFNLRDVLRWLELARDQSGLLKNRSAADYLQVVISQRLRTAEDKEYLVNLFERLVGAVTEHPSTCSLGLETLQAGMAVASRNSHVRASTSLGPVVSTEQSQTLELLSFCIERNWPCILVGPSGSGKTSMIRALASFVGVELHEFSMNNDTDATDILGGYEQRDLHRQLNQKALELQTDISAILSKCSQYSEISFYGKLLTLLSEFPCSDERLPSIRSSFGEMTRNLDPLPSHLFEKIRQLGHLLNQLGNESETGKFQWYDGVLVDAVTQGGWIVLDNANLCNPSVLDRLNSLLEPEGSLILHESTNSSGELRLLKPHPNFRLFLTMDARYGELSRAMRNRAIEVAVDAQNHERYCKATQLELYLDMHPDLRFVQAVLCTTRVLRKDIPTEMNPEIASQILEYTPLRSLSYLQRWLKSSISSQRALQSSVDFQRYSNILLRLPAMEDCFFYTQTAVASIGLSGDFASSQSLLPLLNDYLPSVPLTIENTQTSMVSKRFHEVYDLCMTLANMQRELSQFQEDASKISRDETRALILASKSSVKAVTSALEPARSALRLLQNISAEVESWVSARGYLYTPNKDVEMLSVLLNLWGHMAQMLNAEDLDPSYYSVFKNILNDWLMQNSSTSLVRLTETVRLELETMSKSVALSSGISMPLIWEVARPTFPSTPEQWTAYDELVAISKVLDSNAMMLYDNLNAIVTTKSLILESLTALLSSNTARHCPLQSLKIEEMGFTQRDQSTEGSISREAFSSLHNLVQIQTQGSEAERNLLLRLSQLGGIPLLESLNPVTLGKSLSFESIFRCFPRVLAQISGMQLFKETLRISNSFRTASNREFVVASHASKLFSGLLSQTRDLTLWSSASSILSMVEEDITELLEIHINSASMPAAVRKVCSSLNSMLGSSDETNVANGDINFTCSVLPDAFQYPIQQLHRAICAVLRATQVSIGGLEKYGCVAEACIRFGLACVALYVPDKPNDPAALAIVNYERRNLQVSEARARYETRVIVDRKFRGSNQSLRLRADKQSFEQAIEASSQSETPNVYRPKVSQIPQIQQEFQQILQSTMKSLRVGTVLDNPSIGPSELSTQLSTLVENLERVARRLETNYRCYGDILAFVIGIINRLVFGFRLKLDLVKAESEMEGRNQISVDALLSAAALTTSMSIETWKNMKRALASHEGRLTSVNICALEGIYTADVVTGSPLGSSATIKAILDEFYIQWRVEKERTKVEEAAKTSIYKRKDDEYEIEQAIAEYFPDEKFDEGMTGSALQKPEEDVALKVWALHRELFASAREGDSISMQEILKRRLEIVANHSAMFSGQDVLLTSFPAHLLSLASAQKFIAADFHGKYDFYRSPNFVEIQHLLGIVANVQQEVAMFLEAWPEHATLHDISSLCDKIWNLPASAPLSRMLPYIERFYMLVDQWQQVASRDYSLAEAHHNVKETIVRWRRLELGSWKTLLLTEELRHRQEISSWWFDIYETVIYNLRPESASADIDHLAKVVASLDGFIKAGTLGDYEDRLQLLLTFAAHAHSESTEHPALEQMSRACYHLHHLYSLYLSEVQKTFNDQRTVLEKEVAETVQLASWRDTSVFALTESAKRSHYRLYKTVRKYRELLAQPVNTILQRGAAGSLETASTGLPSPIVPSKSELDLEVIRSSTSYCQAAGVWSTKSRLFLDPAKLSSSIHTIFRQLDAIYCDVPVSVNEFVAGLEDLRKQTPSVLTDENEKQVKFLKTQKRRVFAQTMKSLRDWGIASKKADQTSTSAADAKRMYSTPARKDIPVETKTSWNRIDLDFYQIIDLLPRIRASGMDHSQDLSESEITRARGYIETLVDGLFEQRQTAYDLEESIESLKSLYTQTISVLSTKLTPTAPFEWIVTPSARSYMECRLQILRRLIFVIKTCVSVLEAQAELDSKAQVSPVIKFLDQMRLEAENWLARLGSVSWNDDIIFPDAVAATLRENDFVRVDGSASWSCTDSLDNWLFMASPMISEFVGQDTPSFLFAFQPILDVLKSTDDWEHLTPTPVAEVTPEVSQFTQAAEVLGAGTLVATQELSKLLTQTKDVGVLSYRQIRVLNRDIIRQLHPQSVAHKMRSAWREALPLLSFRKGLQHVLAVFNSLRPILEQYVHGCERALLYLTEYHQSYSQMVHVLMIAFHTLATKGYCSPQRAEKESGPTKGDGVGLGEGEGETDISNEIKDDADLSDLAQQDKGDTKESKGDDNEDGVDLDDDFEGILEDAPEGNENEEEGSEGEEEMDEGVGGVDDADPSAVDEQFWEDQADKPPESNDEKQMQGKKELEDEEGDLAANNKEKAPQDKKESKGSKDAEKDEEEGEGEDGSDVDEAAIQNREDDTIMPEAEPLDIAEDLDLNQPDGEAKAESIFSDDEMDLDGPEFDEEEGAEEFGSDNEMEEQEGDEGMDLDADDNIPDSSNDQPKEDDNINMENVDRSEYQGEDVAESESFGKGGESAATDEKQQGAQDDNSKEERPEPADHEPSSNIQEGANGQGEAQIETQVSQRNATDTRTQSEAARENPYRKLGNMLEQWRRDLQNIQDVADQEQQEQKTVGEQNPEFAYVGEEEQFDTQGLGPAAPEQVQLVDMSMAIDEEDQTERQQKQDESSSREDVQQHSAPQGTEVDSTLYPTSFGASIGDRAKDPDTMDLDQPQATSLDDTLPEPVDTVEIPNALTNYATITEDARQIWRQHDQAVHDLSLSLCEQLRLILEPTLATKMRGDFRTGKRLNMRRIIPYIASDYKKDKIWMRRTKPSKRQYQVMIAMDDSKSMSDSKSVKLAFDTLALTAKALSQLEVGQIGIVRFGEDVKVVHGFDEQFTSESGGKVVQQFQFDQSRTDVNALTRSSIDLFNIARAQQDVRSTTGSELWQLELIISDGICEDHDNIRRMVRQAFEAKIMMIFVILDAIHPERKDSILDIKSYSFEPGKDGGQMLKETRDVRELPTVLASALRQWFAEIAER